MLRATSTTWRQTLQCLTRWSPNPVRTLTTEQVREVNAFNMGDPGGEGEATDGRKSLKQDFTCQPQEGEQVPWGLNNIRR